MSSANRNMIIKALAEAGITNPVSISAIMAVVAKESNFKPQSEKSYSGTSNDRIRSIFSITRNMPDTQLSALKKDPVKFFNLVYGGKYGNSPTEGYKYRGRGFNQLTFKGNYAKYGKLLGIDLVGNPDLANRPDVAAKIVAAYMKSEFKENAGIVKIRYGASDVNDFKDLDKAVNAFYNANAGFGKDTSRTVTSGKTRALTSVAGIYKSVMDFIDSPGGKMTSLGLLLIAGILIYTTK